VPEATAGHGGGARWFVFLLLAGWLAFALPLAFGARTLVARDVFSIHLHLKWVGAQALRHGEIPAVNPSWGLGQPFAGNPNAVAWYPGNLLYLILPFWSAFNLHYALHWLLAFLGVRALARALGQGFAPSLFAALVYTGSGYFLTALTYYNLLPVAAWWPWVLWGAARGDRRGLAWSGLACGMVLLGGEPVTALLGLLPLALVAWRGSVWRTLGVFAKVGVLGIVVALPQLVAFARALPFSYRVAHGLEAPELGLSRLAPWRLLELVWPFPYGHPFLVGPAGFVRYDFQPRLPYVLTLFCGAVALVLAALAVRARARYAALAAAGLTAPMLLTYVPGSLERVTAGLARYPEKAVLWFALGVALLAGFGCERVLADGALAARWLRRAALGLAAAATALFLAATPLASWMRAHAPADSEVLPAAQIGMAVGLVLWGALTLAAAAVAARRRTAGGLLAAQLACVAPLAVLLPTDSVAPYRATPAFAQAVAPEAAIFNGTFLTALGDSRAPYRLADGRLGSLRRLAAEDLAPSPGVLHGLRYPLAPDFDGMDSLPVATVLAELPQLTWPERVRWLRVFGVEAAVLTETPSGGGFRRLASADRAGVATELYAVEKPLPLAWWPRAVHGVASEADVFHTVSANDAVEEDAFVAGPAPAQDAGGGVRVIEEGDDRLVIETHGGGGVVGVQRAFEPFWTARAQGGAALPTLRIDFALLGVHVLPGDQRVVLMVSHRPERLALAVALVAVVGLLWTARRQRRDDTAPVGSPREPR
jgi:hypothetical protein